MEKRPEFDAYLAELSARMDLEEARFSHDVRAILAKLAKPDAAIFSLLDDLAGAMKLSERDDVLERLTLLVDNRIAEAAAIQCEADALMSFGSAHEIVESAILTLDDKPDVERLVEETLPEIFPELAEFTTAQRGYVTRVVKALVEEFFGDGDDI